MILYNYYKKYILKGGEEDKYENTLSFEDTRLEMNKILEQFNNLYPNWADNSRNNVFNNHPELVRLVLSYWLYIDENDEIQEYIETGDEFIMISMAFDYEFNNNNTVDDIYWDILYAFISYTICKKFKVKDTDDNIKLQNRGIYILSGMIGNNIIRQYMSFLFKIKNKSIIPDNIKDLLKEYEVDSIRKCDNKYRGGRNKILYNNYRGGNIKTYYNQYIKYKLKIEKL